MKYLVVDDEEIILSGMKRILTKLGKDTDQVILANNPFAALEAIKEHSDIEIVFSDVDMPGMNGIELAQRLHTANPNLDIIFATGYAHYSLEAWNTVAKAFILKPVDEDDVKTALERVMKYRENKTAVAEPVKKSDVPRLEARCFGNFEIFCDGVPIHFARKKSKEMVAYLIDRRGAMVSTGELRMNLWAEEEDSEEKKGYIRVLANDIRKSFEDLGFASILLNNNDCYALDTNGIACDYFDYMNGKAKAKASFRGEYMSQYPWGEMTLGSLLDD